MKNLLFIFLFILLLGACSKPGQPEQGPTTTVENACENGSDLSKVPTTYLNAISKFQETNEDYTLVVCTEDEDSDGNQDYMVIISTNRPEHESSYYKEGHKHHEEYDYQTNVHKYAVAHTDQHAHSAGHNMIEEQNIVMRIPLSPKASSNPTDAPFATIGLAINGVSFFNENAAPGDEITDELFTFDQCSGHPQQQGVYHYHVDPVCLLRDLGGDVISDSIEADGKTYHWIKDSGNNASLMIGMLVDGFPVYGPTGTGEMDCNGQLVTEEINDFNGHEHCTKEFPEGIFHYHVKTGEKGATHEKVFWITNKVFYGEPGSVGNAE